MFLVPAITEKALGMTYGYVFDYGKYKGQCCTSHLTQGKWLSRGDFHGPPIVNIKTSEIEWLTAGSAIYGGGPEAGYVTASIKFENKNGNVSFGWSNPGSGPNSCVVNMDGPLKGILKPSCVIEQGTFTKAYYCIDGTPIIKSEGSSYYDTCSVSQSNTPPKSK